MIPSKYCMVDKYTSESCLWSARAHIKLDSTTCEFLRILDEMYCSKMLLRHEQITDLPEDHPWINNRLIYLKITPSRLLAMHSLQTSEKVRTSRSVFWMQE